MRYDLELTKSAKSANKDDIVTHSIKRCSILKDIIDQATQKELSLSRGEICKAMQNAGYTKYAINILARDKQIINQSSQFIKNLLTHNYSAYMEDLYDKAQYVEEEATKILRASWNNDTTTTKESMIRGELVTTTETKKTAEVAGPKIQALAIILKSQELKYSVTTGDSLQLSAALLSKKYREMQEELTTAKKTHRKNKQNVTVKQITTNDSHDNITSSNNNGAVQRND